MRILNRRGFTLIELLAALSISALAMIGGILVLDQVTDSTGRIVRTGQIAARDGNGPRVLRQLLLDAHMTADSLDRFRGNERSADFTTLCHRPSGWLESCRVSVAIDWREDTSVVIATLSTGENIELARRAGVAELRYFDAATGDSVWLQRWALSIVLPVAIGIVTPIDTVIYPMGTTRD